MCPRNILTFIISTGYVARKLKGAAQAKEEAVSKKELLKVSAPMMATAFSFLILSKTDTIMLGMLSNTKDVGVYAVALKLAEATSFILYSINAIAAPKFSELYWSNKMEDLKSVVRLSSRIIFWLSAPVLAVYIGFAKPILGLFGAEFTAAQYALIFLSLGQFVNAASGSVGYFMNMTGRQVAYRNIILAATAINVILNYVLIPVYGINGAAVATMISMSFWNIICVIYVNKKNAINTFYIPVFWGRSL